MRGLKSEIPSSSRKRNYAAASRDQSTVSGKQRLIATRHLPFATIPTHLHPALVRRSLGEGRSRIPYPVSRFLVTLCAVLCLALNCSAELFSGRVYTKPDRIYVNQSFDLFIELEVSRGQDIDNIRIQGLPNNPDFITLGQLNQERVRETRRRNNGDVVDVLRFQADALCHKSIKQQFTPVLTCDMVERHSRGFFSFSSSSGRRLQLSSFTLNILDLPIANRPANFSGAVGKFAMKGSVSKDSVRPGDIITLTLELSGSGLLNSIPPPAPEKAEGFKFYPPKETAREDNMIRTEQIYIPGSTNAVAIPPAAFHFFNPESGHYEVCSSPAFKIKYITTAMAAQTNRINVISSEELSSSPATGVTITAHEVNTAFHKILPVIAAASTLLVASFVFLIVFRISKWGAAAASLPVIILGSFLSFKASRYEPAKEMPLKGITDVYLAPSVNTPLVMKLQESAKVIPLESTERWTRIDAQGHRGWIKTEMLAQ